MPPKPEFEIDWSKGRVTLQNGHVFVSPNCKRDVRIPPHQYPPPIPFQPGTNMKAEDFKQPVWWTQTEGWMSFIPLAPSFLPTPFRVLSWYPKLETNGQNEHRMTIDDAIEWMQTEKKIDEAVMRVRNVFKINANRPPLPSVNFNYHLASPTAEDARAVIRGARDWFGIWMGILSFCIADSKENHVFRNADLSAGPVWYQQLYDDSRGMWRRPWLDGLLSSCVCQFDDTVARAGIVLKLTNHDKSQPGVKWFIDHGVPVFYPWTATEQGRVWAVPGLSLRVYEPPRELLQEGLTLLFKSPGSTMAAYIIYNYYSLWDKGQAEGKEFFKWDSASDPVKLIIEHAMEGEEMEVRELLQLPQAEMNIKVKEFMEEQARATAERAQRSVDLPTEGMLDDEDGLRKRGHLVENVEEFFAKRDRRTQECIRMETPQQRQSRLQKEAKPPTRNCGVFEWREVETSGGKVLYLRVRVHQQQNALVIGSYPKSQRLYSGYHDEWDLCAFLKQDQPLKPWDPDSGSESDDGFDSSDWHPASTVASNPRPVSPTTMPSSSQLPRTSDNCLVSPSMLAGPSHLPPNERRPALPPTTPPGQPQRARKRKAPKQRDKPMSPVPPTDVEMKAPEETTEDQRDSQEQSSLKRNQGGFWMTHRAVWTFLLLGYGCMSGLDDLSKLPHVDDEAWKGLIKHMGYSSDEESSPDDRKVIASFFNAMSSRTGEVPIPPHFFDLDPGSEARVSIFPFRLIHRPVANLFVFSFPRSMAVEWLLGVESAEHALYCARYLAVYKGTTIFNLANNLLNRGIKFRTVEGLDLSLRRPYVQTVVCPFEFTGVREHTYRFTKEDFAAWMTQVEELATIPRFRAGLLVGGVVARICRNYMSMDKAMQGPSWEVKRCCVGYMMPTGSNASVYGDDELTVDDLAKLCGAYGLYDDERKRTTVKYWFPPAHVWNSQKCGHSWMEWTELNEQWFEKLWKGYENGTGGQPKTAEEWSRSLRGSSSSRVFQKKYKDLAEAYCNKHIPVTSGLLPTSLLERLSE